MGTSAARTAVAKTNLKIFLLGCLRKKTSKRRKKLPAEQQMVNRQQKVKQPRPTNRKPRRIKEQQRRSRVARPRPRQVRRSRVAIPRTRQVSRHLPRSLRNQARATRVPPRRKRRKEKKLADLTILSREFIMSARYAVSSFQQGIHKYQVYSLVTC